ncbi:PH domain-containing protein [Actinocrinis sp.]|uniref:PH domain-containing protein n=1 Tax=Actinocrinis sp. TaxID=1920516 RepID=UPI002C196BF3|nr:PH domain-containing protein [Actinocrinis sp.]HXR72801.1 PH domain-containing protein [Actinocrinis sp.]
MIDGEPPSGAGSQVAARSAGGGNGDGDWHEIARGRLALARRIKLLALAAVPAVVAGLTNGTAQLVLAAAAAGLLALAWYPLGRSARTWRFRERGEDLLIDHGLLVRKQVVVPYGRMQFVDIVAGPLERSLGICTLRLHTASAASDARIPGLKPALAEQLRDRLAALGEARMAGL